MDLKVGGKRRRGDLKKRLGTRKERDDFRPIRLPNLSVTIEDSDEDVAVDIAAKLSESKQDLICELMLFFFYNSYFIVVFCTALDEHVI